MQTMLQRGKKEMKKLTYIKARKLLKTKKYKDIDLRNPSTKKTKQGKMKQRLKNFVRFHTY